MQLALLSILVLAAPFFLWFPERVFAMPYILEEAVKLFLVSLFPTDFKLKNKIVLAVSLGVLFSLSELVLYFFNLGNFPQSLFFKRLMIVGMMHALTFAVITVSGHKKRSGLLIGFILAILIHFLFNRYLAGTL